LVYDFSKGNPIGINDQNEAMDEEAMVEEAKQQMWISR
jgi:hypothetical protein